MMSELAATSAEPAYINKLALTRLPFSWQTDAAAFYDGSHIKQRRLLLQHLLRATRKPVLLHADAGMGKTTLLEQLKRQSGTDILFCSFSDTPDSLQSCQTILKQLQTDMPVSHDMESCESAIRQRLAQLRRVNIVPVLLVEDLEQRPEALRELLYRWLAWHDEEQQPLWHAVVTSQTVTVADGANFQTMDMPPLELAEVQPYLMQRLNAAAYLGDSPFSDKDIRRFHRASQGNPGRLNQLAHQHLLGSKPKAIWQTGLLRQLSRWSAVLILGLVVMMVLLYQQDINQWFGSSSKDKNEIEVPELAGHDDVTTVVVGQEKQQADAELELAKLLADIPEPGSIESKAETETETETVGTTSVEESESIEPPITKTQSTASPPVPGSTVVTAETPSQQHAESVYRQDWILQQKSTDYTFQLMGAWEESEVDEFIEKYALTGQVARFTSLRDKKPWHVLIYGVYSSRQAALTASNDWPAPLNTVPTWLRRFDSVHKQIREKGVKP